MEFNIQADCTKRIDAELLPVARRFQWIRLNERDEPLVEAVAKRFNNGL